MTRVKYSSLVLSGAIIAIYVLQLSFPPVTELSFVAADFFSEPWTIVTSVFLHSPSDFMHLLNNLFFLAVFGFMLENIIGTRKFLGLFVVSGVLANLSAFAFYPTTPVLGASGAISGVIAALAVIRPRDIGLFWGVPVPMWAALIGWIVTNAAGAAATGGNVAFEAHLYGLFVGAMIGLLLRREHAAVKDDADEPDIDIEEWEEEYMN